MNMPEDYSFEVLRIPTEKEIDNNSIFVIEIYRRHFPRSFYDVDRRTRCKRDGSEKVG